MNLLMLASIHVSIMEILEDAIIYEFKYYNICLNFLDIFSILLELNVYFR
jgi:hypothetical protein